jgi:hypothetical protein
MRWSVTVCSPVIAVGYMFAANEGGRIEMPYGRGVLRVRDVTFEAKPPRVNIAVNSEGCNYQPIQS